jgi:hypothetical protein
MKLDLDAQNVIELTLTVEDARHILDGNDAGDFETNLDSVQGLVGGHSAEEAYLVIKIVR